MNPHSHARRPSPWPGSEHVELYGWALDDVSSMTHAASRIREISAQLEAAHAAGWWLTSPMLDGRLHARRPSRRQRAHTQRDDVEARPVPPPLRVRVRVVDEPHRTEWPALTFESATATPWLALHDGVIKHIAGPQPCDADLAIIAEQVGGAELGNRRWAVVAARIGPGLDLIADGSRLRAHAVVDGAVVRTVETLGFKHAADKAATLPEAAAAYRRLAGAADAMHHAGGRLASADDGFLVVEYPAYAR